MFVKVRDKCFEIGHQEVPDLQSTHEEGDGHLILPAVHDGQNGYPAVIIISQDTDVCILCLAFQNCIGTKLFLKCGSKQWTRLIDIGKGD